jgi:hypothetical protein
VLACPLMHIFMHHGHRHGGHGRHTSNSDDAAPSDGKQGSR